jgi:hypothetical protein
MQVIEIIAIVLTAVTLPCSIVILFVMYVGWTQMTKFRCVCLSMQLLNLIAQFVSIIFNWAWAELLLHRIRNIARNGVYLSLVLCSIDLIGVFSILFTSINWSHWIQNHILKLKLLAVFVCSSLWWTLLVPIETRAASPFLIRWHRLAVGIVIMPLIF